MMTSRRLFLAKLAGLAGFTLLSKAKGDYTKPLSLPVVMPPIPYPKDRQPVIWGRQTIIDYDRLLYCISAVESKHDDTVIGPKGERSRYQIKRSVWEQHWGKKRPFSRCKGEAAWGTAHDHLRWIVKQLSVADLTSAKNFFESPYWIAHAYHVGVEDTLSHLVKVHSAGHDYGDRIFNLYNDPTYQHT